MRGVAIWLAILTGCGGATEPAVDKAPAAATSMISAGKAEVGFIAVFQRCAAGISAGLDTDPSKLGSMTDAMTGCGPLFGEGACRTAWDSLLASETITYEDLIRLIQTCAAQYCAAFGTTSVPACTASSSSWAGHEAAVWTELHAAIMSRLFTDKLPVPPSLVERYRTLPERPTAQDFKAINLAAELPADPASLVDGRQVVFGLTAKFLAAIVFIPAIELTRQTPLRASPLPPRVDSGKPPVSVLLAPDGIWIGSAGGACFRKRIADTEGWDWLEAELIDLKRAFAERSAIELTGTGSVLYQDLIQAMDIAIKVGFRDASIAEPSELQVRLPGPRSARNLSNCAPPKDAGESRSVMEVDHSKDRSVLADAPAVIVTRAEIRVGQEFVMTIKAAAAGRGAIPALAKLLSANASKTVILQADAQTPMSVILRLTSTAASVGKTMLFAVKNK